MSFKDHFSRRSDAYGRCRPGYPPELLACVAGRAPDRHLAVDCATGNGQAAVGQVLRVHYVAGLAERLPVRERSVSRVAAAQAAHWFDIERFHGECRRVLAPGGVLALWTYGKFRVDPAVDAIVDHFYSDVVGRYWPPERRHVEQGYRSLPFPWHEESVPEFELANDWDLDQVMGYFATWSAVQRCQDQSGQDPLPELRPRLAELWPPGGTRRLSWPIHLRLGRA